MWPGLGPPVYVSPGLLNGIANSGADFASEAGFASTRRRRRFSRTSILDAASGHDCFTRCLARRLRRGSTDRRPKVRPLDPARAEVMFDRLKFLCSSELWNGLARSVRLVDVGTGRPREHISVAEPMVERERAAGG